MARPVYDYFAVAVAIASRHHRPLLTRCREYVIHECWLLAWEAEPRRYITVKNGTTVTWRNTDTMNHPVKEAGTLFTSPDMGKNAEFSYTFDKAGTYKVVVTSHPGTEMTVVVE